MYLPKTKTDLIRCCIKKDQQIEQLQEKNRKLHLQLKTFKKSKDLKLDLSENDKKSETPPQLPKMLLSRNTPKTRKRKRVKTIDEEIASDLESNESFTTDGGAVYSANYHVIDASKCLPYSGDIWEHELSE